MSDLILGPDIQRVLQAESIGVPEVKDMVLRSAIHSGDGCNRRFHNWLFLVKDGVLLKMMTLEYRTVAPAYQGTTAVEEDCMKCYGEGCRFCGWRGVVRRNVKDPAIDCK